MKLVDGGFYDQWLTYNIEKFDKKPPNPNHIIHNLNPNSNANPNPNPKF